MSVIPLPERLRENIRRLVQSMASGEQCRLSFSRVVRDKERSLRAMRLMLRSLLKTRVSVDPAVASRSVEGGRETRLLRCMYREHLVDGACGPACGAPLGGAVEGRAVYCSRHAYMCAEEHCSNLVDQEQKKCTQCQRQYKHEGLSPVAAKLSA